MRVFILGFAITVSSASLALAADLGQYRPGSPYQSVIAQSADICESHCAGDAQCRSWNYVQPNPNMAGVCEFNATNASPVPSSVSISGTNSFGHETAGTHFNDRLVAGGTNTIRVGAQPAAAQRSAVREPKSNRRIVREPVPNNIKAQTASTRPVIKRSNAGSLTAQQNQYRSGQATAPQRMQPPQQAPQAMPPQYQQQAIRAPKAISPTQNRSGQPPQSNAVPQFRYNLGDQAYPSAPQMQRPAAPNTYAGPSNNPQNYNAQAHNPQIRPQAVLPQNLQHQATHNPANVRNRRHQQGPTNRQAALLQNQMQQPLQAQGRQVQQGQAYPPQNATPQPTQNYASAQQAWPAIAAPNMERRAANRPVTHMDSRGHQMTSNPMAPQSPQSLAQGLTAEQAHQSLFGKLNDDVRVPSSGLNAPVDPNAPIAMSASRPAGVVEQGQLGGLVGAPRR